MNEGGMIQMKKVWISASRRTAAALLAGLLCLSLTGGALAAEGEDFSALESSLPEQTEEALEPAESEEQSALLESDEEGRAANLLVTGGHAPYMNGDKGYFRPEAYMKRSEVAQMLYNLLAAKPAVSSSRFPDVDINAWYGTAVNALAEKNVLSGYGDGSFLPNRTITRAEFVKVIVSCFGLEGGTASFEDTKNHWARDFIAAAASAGWIDGVREGVFDPNAGLKRCQAVKIMNLALGRTGDGYAADRGTQKFWDVPSSHWAYLDITEAAPPGSINVEPDPGPDPSKEFKVGQTVQVVASALNLRSGPGTSYGSIGMLQNGDTLTVTDISSLPWLGVKTAVGQTGFAHSGDEDDPYLVVYVPGQAAGAKLSSSALTLHQYESARLDASVTSGLGSMTWTSSDPSVAIVGYTIDYGSGYPGQQGAMVYGKKPGTTTLTFADQAGKTQATCKITVTGPEGVRSGYGVGPQVSGRWTTPKTGTAFDLVAVTESGRTSVTFKVSGPASGTFSTSEFTKESRISSMASESLPTNNVRVFKRSVTFAKAGLYTVQATANGYSDSCQFQVYVMDGSESMTTASTRDRRVSWEMLQNIAAYEGQLPDCKDDPLARKNPTVGYGYVVPVNTTFYNNLTPSEMRSMLAQKANEGGYVSSVNSFRSKYDMKMSQTQFDAMVSFAYNLGPGYFSPDYGFFRVMLNATNPPSSGTGTVNQGSDEDDDNVFLFEKADRTSKNLGKIKVGSSVTITGSQVISEKKQVWYQVSYGGKTGWVPAGYIGISGASHDLTYADSTVLANNILQWNKAGGIQPGLVWRRLGECKIFFFGDYSGANPASSDYHSNTYGFKFPSEIADYDR